MRLELKMAKEWTMKNRRECKLCISDEKWMIGVGERKSDRDRQAKTPLNPEWEKREGFGIGLAPILLGDCIASLLGEEQQGKPASQAA